MELVPLKLFDTVAFQVKCLQGHQTVKSMILHTGDQRVVEVESLEIFATDKSVAVEFAHVVAVQENLGGVHGKLVGQIVKVRTRTFGDIFRPRIVVVAGAIIRAGHLTITGVVFAAMAQSETMGLQMISMIKELFFYF